MDKNTFAAADSVVDEIADAVGVLLNSPETATVRSLLAKLNEAIGKRYLVSLNVNVDVFDQEEDRSMPLLQTGLTGFDADKPYQTWGDSSPQRYVVEGEIVVVPNDRCPRCWESWLFKFQHLSCEHCGATMGKEVKLLLDTDVCPFCEKGKVSMSNPVCDKCGHTVDPNRVAWG